MAGESSLELLNGVRTTGDSHLDPKYPVSDLSERDALITNRQIRRGFKLYFDNDSEVSFPRGPYYLKTYPTPGSLVGVEWEFLGGGSGGATSFDNLTDTPASKVASTFVKVNSSATALEYVTVTTITPQQASDITTNNAKRSYPIGDEAKLAGIEDGATTDQTGAEIKSLYESEANTNAFTDSEKSKLAGLESSKFLGVYLTLLALETAHPSPPDGSYGDVDAGTGTDTVRYIWDSSDNQYVPGGAGAPLTPSEIKVLYESNADTNAFTDAEKSKLAGIENNATANDSNAQLRDRSTHTGTQTSSTISDFTSAVDAIVVNKEDKLNVETLVPTIFDAESHEATPTIARYDSEAKLVAPLRGTDNRTIINLTNPSTLPAPFLNGDYKLFMNIICDGNNNYNLRINAWDPAVTLVNTPSSTVTTGFNEFFLAGGTAPAESRAHLVTLWIHTEDGGTTYTVDIDYKDLRLR